MSASPEELFDKGLDVFGGVVSRLDGEAWSSPSEVEGWSNLDVLGHMGGNLEQGIKVMQGGEPEWPDVARPGELVDGDPQQWWDRIAAETRAALAEADLDAVTDTPLGPRAARDRLAFPAVDLYVHAWDIGNTVGMDVDIPEDVIELAHTHIDPIPEEMVRGPGVFGPEVEAPPDASPQEAFLAWTGRRPR